VKTAYNACLFTTAERENRNREIPFNGMDSVIFYKIRQDRQYYQDFFCHHQFPEEIDDTQSTFGGRKFRIDTIASKFNFRPNNHCAATLCL
jgi:hypothetical protein